MGQDGMEDLGEAGTGWGAWGRPGRDGGHRGGQDGMGDTWEGRMGWGTHGEARIGWGTHSGARMRGPRPVDTGVFVPGTPSCADREVCCHTVLFIDDQRAFLFLSEDLTIVPAGSKPPSFRRSLGTAS